MVTHIRQPDVEYFRTRRLTVSALAGGEDVPFQADVELVGYAPVTFEVSKHQLKVLAPAP